MSECISKRILLVEDEAILAMTEKIELEKYGYTVRTVNSGEKAVETATTVADIDLILMDINLGNGIDGTQAAGIILKDHDIPIVFLSSHTDPEIVGKTEKITSYGYVVKSSSITVLDASIKMAFRLFETRRQASDTFTHSINGLCVHRLILDESGNLHDCEYLRVNRSFERHTGLLAQDIIGRTIRDLYPGTQANDLIRLYEEVLSGRADAQQEIYFEPTQAWYEISIFRTHEDEFTVVVHNITERKQAEEELRRSEAIKNAMVSNIGDVIVVIDNNGINQYKSPNITKLFGWKPEELIGKNTWDNVHPDDLEAGQEFISTIAKEPNAAGTTEVRYKRKDGSYVWIEITVRNLLHDKDIQGILGNYHDITEKKMAEDELSRFKTISDNAIYGNAIADLQGNLLYINRFFATIHGYEPVELIGKHFSIFHNEPQRAKAGILIASMIQEGHFAPTTVWHCHRDGTEFPLLMSGILIKDEYGNPQYLAASAVDITDRIRVEKALIESEALFRGMFQDHSAVMLLVDPGTGQIIMANQAATQYYGYPLEKLLQKKIQQLNTLSPAEIAQEMGSALNRQFNIFKFRHRLADGQVRDVEVHSAPITIQHQTLLFSIIHDITERKQVEYLIQKQLSEKEILLREVHHRIKNNIANIESLLSLQASSTANAEAKVALQDAISRIQSLRVLYDKLLVSEGVHEVSMRNFAEGLIDSLVMAYDSGKNITIEKHISDFKIDAKKAFFVGIIVNELLTNVFKYAFGNRAKGVVSVSIDKEDGIMTLIIQDNGSGFDEKALENKSPGFGRTIVKMLVEQLDGSYSSVNENGARSVVRFGI